MDILKIKVDNVKCSGCVANISSNLKDIGGVENIQVDIPDGMVTVSGHNLDSVQIKEKLIALGYPPSNG